jgi:LuxR family maltose regulon positive regulatory protein
MAYFFLARVRLSQGDISGAEALMIKMDQASQHPTVSPPYRARYVASRAMFAVWQHDLKAVADWGSKLSDYGNTLVIEYQYVPPRLLMAQGKKEEAANLLRDLYEKFIRVGADGLAINIRAYQALAAENETEALEYISDALVKGEPEGYVRTFVDEGEHLKPLLQKALSKGITPEYAGKLLTIIKAEERQRQKTGGAAVRLSKREREILRLLAEEFSNKQITDRLNISLSTVKTHVHNILEKMNAGDRNQAVSRARELKLI